MHFLHLAGIIMIVITNFLPFNVYYLPITKPFVGFRTNKLSNGEIAYEFYPLK